MYKSAALTARVFVGTVAAVLLAVAEEAALDAVSVAARQEAVLAERLVGDEQRLHLALLVLRLAVLHRILPVARLLLDVEVQTGWTANGLQALKWIASYSKANNECSADPSTPKPSIAS